MTSRSPCQGEPGAANRGKIWRVLSGGSTRSGDFSACRRRRAAFVMAALALPGVFLATAASAAASPAAAAVVSHARGTTAISPAHGTATAVPPGKPVPVRPPSTRGAGLGAAIPAKPHGLPITGPLTTWTVTLTASPNLLWPTQYSTLTATASMDVGPTPYYLRVYDLTAGAYVVTCATGTTCATAVTYPIPADHCYVAMVWDPSSGEQAVSGNACVTWHGVLVTLVPVPAVPAIVRPGDPVELTATTSQDIGPSPFWTEIFDMTAGTQVAVCGSGTTCSVPVSQTTATTHEYIAYVSDDSTAYPPPGIQATSQSVFVTWSNLGWQVSLSAPSGTFSTETVTATANGDVGSTTYYIEIFDEDGTPLAICATGSTCSVTFAPALQGSHLVAFISAYDTAFPPAGIVASSNEVTTYLQILQ